MDNLKSFSVGHTAKGTIWWQAWPFDGEARKGTADSVEAALAAIGIAAPTTAEVAAVSREYSDLCAERADDRERVKRALEAKDAEIADLMGRLSDCQSQRTDARHAADLLRARVARLEATIATMETLLPDSADPSDNPAPQATEKGHSRPATPRKAVKAPEGTAPEVEAYLRQVRGVV